MACPSPSRKFPIWTIQQWSSLTPYLLSQLKCDAMVTHQEELLVWMTDSNEESVVIILKIPLNCLVPDHRIVCDATPPRYSNYGKVKKQHKMYHFLISAKISVIKKYGNNNMFMSSFISFNGSTQHCIQWVEKCSWIFNVWAWMDEISISNGYHIQKEKLWN